MTNVLEVLHLASTINPAPDWNGVLHDENGVFDQLAALGNQGLYLA